ncbi:MAG: DUF192 domain-containing protein [Deltaproteobacteria bacterium]|nr:DUF192 domain-containing protein [Deltaproteobacteria bacterium]
MQTNFVATRSLSLIFTIILLLWPCLGSGQSQATNSSHSIKALAQQPTVPVTLGKKTITATLANTNATRINGLLGWNEIKEDQGMLLDFMRSGIYAIHMQGMNFPIDALWIDSNGVIKLIYDQIQPNSGITYPSMFEIRYCLEIAAGFCKKYGIKTGDRIVLGN